MTAKDLSSDVFMDMVREHEKYVDSLSAPKENKAGKQLILEGYNLYNLRLENTRLHDAIFSECRFVNCSFINCELHCRIHWSYFETCTMRDCKMRKLYMNGCDCIGLNFDGSLLSRVEVYRSNLACSSFYNADLGGSFFFDCDLRYVRWENANLLEVRIVDSNLYNPQKYKVRNADTLTLKDCIFNSKRKTDDLVIVETRDVLFESL